MKYKEIDKKQNDFLEFVREKEPVCYELLDKKKINHKKIFFGRLKRIIGILLISWFIIAILSALVNSEMFTERFFDFWSAYGLFSTIIIILIGVLYIDDINTEAFFELSFIERKFVNNKLELLRFNEEVLRVIYVCGEGLLVEDKKGYRTIMRKFKMSDDKEILEGDEILLYSYYKIDKFNDIDKYSYFYKLDTNDNDKDESTELLSGGTDEE